MEFDIHCPFDDCGKVFEYYVETEDMGAGSEHDIECPNCERKIYFEIEYFPTICNERGEE
jgi:hypothetical protein